VGHQHAEPQQWLHQRRLNEVDHAATRAGGSLIDRAFTRGLLLLLAFFALLLGYRWASLRMGRGGV
jgi:hypothetical protein